MAMRLQRKPHHDVRELLQLFPGWVDSEFEEDPLVIDFAEFEVTSELDGLVRGMAKRALSLLRYLSTIEKQVTRDYLLRVARCYVFGMHPETIVMCGAVLESALDEFLPLDDRRRTLGRKIGDLENDVLTGKALEAARTINKMRSDAVHLRLESLPDDAIEAIGLLSEVFSSLDRD